MKAAALIVAAGGGSRAGGDIPKQYRTLAGKPLLAWSLAAFRGSGVDTICVVADPAHAGWLEPLLDGAMTAKGGATRTESVRAGLAALSGAGPDIVFIHDAARPGLSSEMIVALQTKLAEGYAGAAPALPAADALKRVGADGAVADDVAREGLARVQTPQAFRYAAIVDAYAKLAAGTALDDDLAAARAAGYAVTLTPGDPKLMKATYPEDFAVLARMLGPAEPALVAVGNGFDAHRFGPGDHVTLCGVRIAHDKGLVGHSDADAGWHALTDAILGALALGDIGDHFPPSDPQWKGADSALFLAHAKMLAEKAGAAIAHVDVTLICERPKIAPHRAAMRARTAEVLGLAPARVSVKATTTERMGFLGREEGLAAQASATLVRA